MGTYDDVNPTPLDMTGFTTVFFDGFNGTQLDWTKWPITYGGSMYWNNAFWWDNGQISVGDGALTIGMDKQSNGIWTVGGLSTMPYEGAPAGHGHTFTYGRVEIRAKTSVEVEGAGPCFLLWPADNSWPPEVDILETPKGGQGMFTVHWPGPGGGPEGRGYDSQFFDLDHSQWHTYTLDWFPDRLTLYVDGVKVAETTENIPDIPMSVGLQGHVGLENDGWYGNPNDTGVDSVDINVDWVRVSKFDGGTTPPPPPKPDPEPPAPPVPGVTRSGTAGDDALTGGTGADRLSGLAGHDRLSGLAGADTVQGGEGRDTTVGGAGNDLVEGGAGNDVLRGGVGDDRIATGAGADTVVFRAGHGHDVVTDFTLGADRLRLVEVATETVTASATARDGVAGLELRLAGGESLFLVGLGAVGAGQLGLSGSFAAGPAPVPPTTATVTGTAGDDWLKGGAGADLLLGLGGIDDLQGGAGNDVLRGGRDHDGLTGGAGVDTFAFARGDGFDWIVDFAPGVEKLRLEGIAAAEVSQRIETRWEQSGLLLDLGGGDEIFLAGIAAPIGQGDMVFA